MKDLNSTQKPAVIYLHGLASSPQSAKANFFRERFSKIGWDFVSPDLNEPDFRSTTLSRALADVSRELSKLDPTRPVILVGSSFGGLAALHAYNKHRAKSQIAGLILLAPAFDFLKNKEMSPGDLEKWKAARDVVVCHNNLPLNYGIIEDLGGYNSYGVSIDVPCLVIHGRQDATIGVEQSERFKAVNPQVELTVFEDDHQLLRSFPAMWGKANNDTTDVGIVPEFIARKICPLQ